MNKDSNTLSKIIERDGLNTIAAVMLDIENNIIEKRHTVSHEFNSDSGDFILYYNHNNEKIEGKIKNYKVGSIVPLSITAPGYGQNKDSISTNMLSKGASGHNMAVATYSNSRSIEDRTPSSYEEDFLNVYSFLTGLNFINAEQISVSSISINSIFIVKALAEKVAMSKKMVLPKAVTLFLPPWFGIATALKRCFLCNSDPIQGFRESNIRSRDINLNDDYSFEGNQTKTTFCLEIILNEDFAYQQRGFLKNINTIMDVGVSLNIVVA
ncbi:MAG: hypothetical protein H7844_08785 [Nitrospirae bacterium YQR-1]